MGFIDYHGKKEDHYTDVVDYSRSQQDEEKKKRDEIRIHKWLIELYSEDKYSNLSIQDLLKLVMSMYMNMHILYTQIINSSPLPDECDANSVWNDFSIAMVDDHILSFDVDGEKREKHIQTFIDKIFKLDGSTSTSEHIAGASDNWDYKAYLDCFNPTKSGRYFFDFLKSFEDTSNGLLQKFFILYRDFVIVLDLYLFKALKASGEEWMEVVEAENSAIYDIANSKKKNRNYNGVRLFNNPLKKLTNSDLESTNVSSLNNVNKTGTEEHLSKSEAKTDLPKIKLKLKPSALGQYYELKCDRSLVYNSIDDSVDGIYETLEWNEPSKGDTAATIAGNNWEKMLFEKLKDDQKAGLCRVIDFKSGEEEATLEGFIRILRNLEPSEKPIYLYQSAIRATRSFNQKYLSGISKYNTNAFISNLFPDFIRLQYVHTEKKYELTVIDAKNASSVKVGAEIQIALYVEIIKHILLDNGINTCYVNDKEGIVWNREKITNVNLEHVFDMRDALKELEEFFSVKLPQICEIIDSCSSGSEILDKLKYGISQKCEYCGNYEKCKEKCRMNASARLLPYITPEAQKRLEELLGDGLEDDSIKSVKNILFSDPKLLTDDCSFWNNIKNNIDAYEKGIVSYRRHENERFPKNEMASISFPVYQDFSLILTAQQDVDSGRSYAYAWLLAPNKDVAISDWQVHVKDDGFVDIKPCRDESSGKGTYFNCVIAQAATSEEFDRIDREFVEGLYNILNAIDSYPDESHRRLQCYVMDHYERKNIENCLFNMLENLDSTQEQELLEKVLTILFWMQNERTVEQDEIPEEVVESPVSVLTTEISRFYVLSEGMSYNLKRTSEIFRTDTKFDESDYSFFRLANQPESLERLSNVIEGLYVLDAWKEDDQTEKTNRLCKLEDHLIKRLFIESEIVLTIQSDIRQGIVLSSKDAIPYKKFSVKYGEDPERARLYFENRYEQLLTYQRIRGVRASGIENAIDNGNILLLEYTGVNFTYKVLNYENYVGREWFSAYLCEDTYENRTQIGLLRDKEIKQIKIPDSTMFKCEDSCFYSQERGMQYDFSYGENENSVYFEFVPKKDKNGECYFKPEKGKKYLLFEMYVDFNSKKTEDGINRLKTKDRDFLKLLDPVSMSGSTGIVFDRSAEEICSQYWSPDNYCFSKSQLNAFKHLMENKLTVLVGPPASGKTDFISRSLITISSYYKKAQNKNIKILVSANSHSAIDNVLLKLGKMLRKDNQCNIKLYKVASELPDSQLSEGGVKTIVERYDSNAVVEKMDQDEVQIFGMTCWSAYKAFIKRVRDLREFDIIVLDEASQVRAMDSFLPFECSNDDTRFLLVGDDDQLPPIIAGKYTEKEGEKYIYGSVFHMFMTGLGRNHPDIVRLSDNFRMNGILCKYPSIAIPEYGPDYKAYNDEIKYQTISLKNKSDNELLDFILDENYPLVFIELSGIARDQTKFEVGLVTELIRELWANQFNKQTNNLASVDGNFWEDKTSPEGIDLEGACGIISPHHEHINRLKTSISSKLNLNREDIFIGTVDKLQGKERKTVIVSYGVSEYEKIANESEFIFSRNRFNVSITRGKAKTIIILSDAIAESNLNTNIMKASGSDENLKKGITFIHGFSEYMKNPLDGEDMQCVEYPFYDDGNVSLKIWKKRLSE